MAPVLTLHHGIPFEVVKRAVAHQRQSAAVVLFDVDPQIYKTPQRLPAVTCLWIKQDSQLKKSEPVENERIHERC